MLDTNTSFIYGEKEKRKNGLVRIIGIILIIIITIQHNGGDNEDILE